MQVQGLGFGIGKMAGRAFGYMSPVHPWATGHIGAQVGGPAVSGMVRSILESPSVPPGVAEGIVQDMKNGTISPGEGTRRLSKLGINTQVQKPYWKADTYPDTGSQ